MRAALAALALVLGAATGARAQAAAEAAPKPGRFACESVDLAISMKDALRTKGLGALRSLLAANEEACRPLADDTEITEATPTRAQHHGQTIYCIRSPDWGEECRYVLEEDLLWTPRD